MSEPLHAAVLAELRQLRDALTSAQLWPRRCAEHCCSIDVERVERELGVRLPADYRAFCELMAGVNCSLWQLFRPCPPSCDSNKSLLANCRWLAQPWHPPQHLLPFFGNGLGDYVCFDLSRPTPDGYAIVMWRHDAADDDDDPIIDLEESFIAWLRGEVSDLPPARS